MNACSACLEDLDDDTLSASKLDIIIVQRQKKIWDCVPFIRINASFLQTFFSAHLLAFNASWILLRCSFIKTILLRSK